MNWAYRIVVLLDHTLWVSLIVLGIRIFAFIAFFAVSQKTQTAIKRTPSRLTLEHCQTPPHFV